MKRQPQAGSARPEGRVGRPFLRLRRARSGIARSDRRGRPGEPILGKVVNENAARGPGATREAGASASVAELTARLATAPPSFLRGAVENPALDEGHLALLLRNRQASPDLLRDLARNRRWTRSYDVKRGLVLHPRTPAVVARTLLDHLYWRDLNAIAGDLKIHPTVRRRAEEILRVRLDELTVGERVALARRSSRGLIAALRERGEAAVLEALLGNPRLVEGDAVCIARAEGAPSEVLARVADHPVWGLRQAVRAALLRNPRTPVHASMRLLKNLPRQELRKVRRDPEVPRVVRVAAERSLEGCGPGAASRS